MKIFVTSKNKARDTVKRENATHAIVIMDVGKQLYPHPLPPENVLKLNFEDDLEDGVGAPKKYDVERILKFARDNLNENSVVVINCHAGMSRSTAAALIIMVQEHGNDKIDWCIEEMVRIRDCAIPNSLITKFADEMLGCDGELHEKAEAHCDKYMFKNWGI